MYTNFALPQSVEKDVFNSFLVRNATYDGKEEIPIVETSGLIPKKLITFSKTKKRKDFDSWIHFYEYDSVFGIIPKNICLL